MGELIGLGVGTGLFLIWSAFFLPRRHREGRSGLQTSLGRLLGRAGLGQVTVSSVMALSAGLALAALVVVWVVTATLPVALAFALMAGYLPVGVLRSRARRRQEEFAQVWPEAVDNLVSAVRAGLSLPDALGGLGVSGPPALRAEFARFSLDYQVTGRFSESLDRLKENLSDPVGDRMVEGLRVAREVGGGDLGRLLRNLAHYLREDARTRQELLARQAWTVNGARLAVAAPWVVLLLMSFQSDAITAFSSAGGVLVLGIGAGACFGAYAVMTRMGRLPVERRILA